ncbi:hypothetical protein A3B45_04265 [Candidatus Daviesbacteria bacterium RIFCSPLOWO2_01_FULL_39_12]|uniref:DUF5667 domain-containing protein n=1 Tax=Candidatus Daviesbacteria bacterium RIFCSPLOWO2_01_FULL_39_12 TaxID=1797785 RepID=A0A1F5KNC9_9BACT|nr:MAG: hypothetical protein A3D79_00620 [Candidatus Daviesbacteria bacterium RIFCSPHIGHO2_02_FULL_39_8]OGE42392.1 MAG: hypothetical protein A3B45_04265 [Candidatus Daviesbacteria bacterium RIFCSPLOWO2_01_FULL_39_12]
MDLKVIIILIAVIALGGFLYLKSGDSLPGDRIYPIKSIKEEIYLSLNSLNFESLIDANIVLANDRAKEVVKLVENQAKEDLIRETLLRLNNNQRSVLDYTIRIRTRGSFAGDYFNKAEAVLEEHQKILSNLYYAIPNGLYSDLDNALDTTSQLLDRVRANR